MKSSWEYLNHNPVILSGKPAHGGVALLWKDFVNDFVTPLEEIDSDRILVSVASLATMTHYLF